jgi:hypothetical protein
MIDWMFDDMKKMEVLMILRLESSRAEGMDGEEGFIRIDGRLQDAGGAGARM